VLVLILKILFGSTGGIVIEKYLLLEAYLQIQERATLCNIGFSVTQFFPWGGLPNVDFAFVMIKEIFWQYDTISCKFYVSQKI
jgi:hypothetical protein